MINSSRLPLDVLLGCLRELDVNDILSAERTCKHVRNTIANRHLWLSKLYGLEQCCAPDLAPHVDPSSLSYPELRSIVIRAFRNYYLMMKGPTSTANYTSTKIIVANRPRRLAGDNRFRVVSVKFVPGGRFLFLRCVATQYNELRLLDLEHENNCIWSFDFGTISEGFRDDRVVIGYDFEFRRDETMLLAFACPRKYPLHKCCIKVLHLDLSATTTGSVQETVLGSSEVEDGRITIDSNCCSISGRFAAFAVAKASIVLVDCEEKKVVRIRLAESDKWLPGNLRVWSDHLFYVDDPYTFRKSLCAFSLVEAMSCRPSPSADIELDASFISSFDLLDIKDEKWTGAWSNMAFSVYDFPARNDAKSVMVSIILARVGWRIPHFVLLRVRFDKNEQSDAKWTGISVRTTEYPHPFNVLQRGVCFRSDISQSGRLLITVQGPKGAEDTVYRLVAVDRRDNLVFPRLSDNISATPVWKDGADADDSAGLPEILEPYMERYSGMLVKLKDRGSGRDVIEIYRPA